MRKYINLFEDKLPKLPQQVEEAFVSLGDMQRGAPEIAMLKVQHASGSGVLSFIVEHTGDLTHRMSHMANYMYSGYTEVAEKTGSILRTLRHQYGFEKEMEDNFVNNVPFKDTTIEKLRQDVHNKLELYAQEHEKLPVYNRAQWLAREAAIAVGGKRFFKAENFVAELNKMVNSDNWDEYAFDYALDESGNILQYDRILRSK